MKQSNIPAPPNFNDLRDFFETERRTIIRLNGFSEEGDYVRSLDQALLVLEFLEKLQNGLWASFKSMPSLTTLFSSEFGSYNEFVSREKVLELCFLDNHLFPDKELFDFTKDGQLDLSVFPIYLETFEKWLAEKKTNHQSTQEILEKNFSQDTRLSKLPCQCLACTLEYRAKLYDLIYEECILLIENARNSILENIDDEVDKLSRIFHFLQQDLDKKIFGIRYRLKRSSLNKLEAQIKKTVREIFTYPSDLAIEHTQNLLPFFKSLLKQQNIKTDMVSEEEYKKFFRQLSTNIWKNTNYLGREFNKLIKSVLMLKRKDISAKILREYLGQFWLHSTVRTLKRQIVYHMGPTNSGKTYYAVDELCKAPKGCYLAPLRLLAAELYDTMNSKGVRTSMITGEEVIDVDNATHYSSTIEMARLQEPFDCCVIDEIQMLADPQRGWAWTRALVNIFSPIIHICGDHTAYDLIQNIVELCGDTLEIKKYERMTKLVVEKRPTVMANLKRSDALIVFSRRNALKCKMALEQLDFKVSIVYGRLSPEVRREQARKFDHGETDIIVATDAIAMGMNLPIRRIVFSTLSKYINTEEYRLTSSEIKQISGRSGRYLRFPTGYITCLASEENGIEDINNAIDVELEQKTKCMVGPDLDIFTQVNNALQSNGLPVLKLSEFLRLFNTMTFKKPFFCVDLQEMIELAEMVEEADQKGYLSDAEIFGFACAPVNLGIIEHVHYFMWIANHFVNRDYTKNELIDHHSDDIDYLETSIKCVELYQWLARHFNDKYFEYNISEVLHNKGQAIEKLNTLLSDKIIPTCSNCGCPLEEKSRYAICEKCFRMRRLQHKNRSNSYEKRKRGPSRTTSGPKIIGDKIEKDRGQDRGKGLIKGKNQGNRNRSRRKQY